MLDKVFVSVHVYSIYRMTVEMEEGKPLCRLYTPNEGLDIANLINRKLGVFDRKLDGSHSILYCYFDIYQK